MAATAKQSGGKQASGGQTRRCLATGVLQPRDVLLRFALTPDGELVPDIASKLPGRGLWITPKRSVLAAACRKNLFSRSAKRPVRLRDDLLDRTADLAQERCLSLLGMARRGGNLLAGFDKVREAMLQERVGVLVQAVDASDDGRGKLMRLAKVKGLPVVECFSRMALDAAIGRENTVHVAVLSGGISDKFMAEIARLGDFVSHAAPDHTDNAPSRASG